MGCENAIEKQFFALHFQPNGELCYPTTKLCFWVNDKNASHRGVESML
jgi:hypothetical protein